MGHQLHSYFIKQPNNNATLYYFQCRLGVGNQKHSRQYSLHMVIISHIGGGQFAKVLVGK